MKREGQNDLKYFDFQTNLSMIKKLLSPSLLTRKKSLVTTKVAKKTLTAVKVTLKKMI